MKLAEAQDFALSLPKLIEDYFGTGRITFVSRVVGDPKTPLRAVVVYFVVHSPLEEYGACFWLLVTSIMDKDEIKFPDKHLGTLFKKIDNQGKRIVLVTSILRTSYLWYGEFLDVLNDGDTDGAISWSSFLHGLADGTSLWIKIPKADPSKIYVGGFSDAEQVCRFVTAICYDDLPFQGISILDLRRRPWNGEIEFPGKYAIGIHLS